VRAVPEIRPDRRVPQRRDLWLPTATSLATTWSSSGSTWVFTRCWADWTPLRTGAGSDRSCGPLWWGRFDTNRRSRGALGAAASRAGASFRLTRYGRAADR